MAKRRNMGGRPAKAGASVTPMKLSEENREIAKTIGSGNMTAGVEKALFLASLLSEEDYNLIRVALRNELKRVQKEKASSILLANRTFYTNYHDSLARLDEKVKAIELVLENTIHNSNA